MKATEARLLDFLKRSPQFVIPIYQRTYSWTEKECRQLWDDIMRAGRSESVSVHFVGSIVYVSGSVGPVYPAILASDRGPAQARSARISAAMQSENEHSVEPVLRRIQVRNYKSLKDVAVSL